MIPSRRRPSSYLAAGRPALARRADAAAHFRPLRADPARLSDRGISRRPRGLRRRQVGLRADQLGARALTRTRRPGCSGRPTRRAGRTRSSPTPISTSTTCARSSTGWRAIRSCAACACSCTGTKTRSIASPRGPTSSPTPRSAATSRHLADYGRSFDLQVFAPQMADAADLAEACPNVTFVLQHAGMLEDLSTAGRAEWRAGMVRLAACPNVSSKLSGLGTFLHRNDPAHIADVVRETVGSSAPGAACSARTFRSRSSGPRMPSSSRAYRDAVAALAPKEQQRDPARHGDEGLSHRAIGRATEYDSWEGIMALEIKILDYGDIELEFELPCARARLRPHAARADARISHPRRRLSDCSSTPATARTRSWRRSACAGCSSTRT